MEVNKKMEIKGNKEERDTLFGPRGEEFRWGSCRRRELEKTVISA